MSERRCPVAKRERKPFSYRGWCDQDTSGGIVVTPGSHDEPDEIRVTVREVLPPCRHEDVSDDGWCRKCGSHAAAKLHVPGRKDRWSMWRKPRRMA